ncbi:acetyltransferase [Flavobacterium sp.]|uniref:acetyltransferase n=1 Tax=Flavobacterium sp. TaxID=239 RepID=UPI003FA5B3F2
METKINLYGASGHCKVIVDILLSNKTTVGKIIDDNPKLATILNFEVQKKEAFVFEAHSNWIISIGNNKVRKMLSHQLQLNFVVAVHSKAVVSPFTTIGEGTVIMAGVIINPDVAIGKHCIINTGAVLEHDCIIHDFAHISPSVALAGGVIVGEGSHIGIGASIIQGVKIGKWATIGAGAVVLKDIPDYAVVVGNPGRILKYNKENE